MLLIKLEKKSILKKTKLFTWAWRKSLSGFAVEPPNGEGDVGFRADDVQEDWIFLKINFQV